MYKDKENFYTVALVIIMASLVSLFVLYFYQGYQINNYPVDVTFTEGEENISLGVSTDSDRISFGVLPPETVNAKKKIFLENKGENPVKFDLEVQGNITKYIQLNEKELVLPAKSNKYITLTIVSNKTKPGYFSGEVIVKRSPARDILP